MEYDEVLARNVELNALLFIRPRQEFEEDQERIRERIKQGVAGRLAGLTFAIKANICVRGCVTSCASRTLEGFVSPYDAEVVEAIKREDGLILGIANCDEFAAGSSGTHSAFGPTRNPLALDRIPGGSSSGSAVSVAAGMVDCALGSDTGGSIRNPASHCGVIGIKPSYGRVSRHGLMDLSMSLDQIGPIARDVETARKVMEVIAFPSHKDPVSFDTPLAPLDVSPKQMRIAYLDTSSLQIDSRIEELVRSRARALADTLGTTLEIVELPHLDRAIATYYPIVYTEFYSATRKYDGRRFGKRIEDVAGPEVLRRILAGSMIASEEDEHRFYRKALAYCASLRTHFDALFESFDAIVLPTVPRIARRIDDPVSPEEEYAEDALTIPANLAGICAASHPAGMIDGLPVGIQIFADRMREDVLFAMLDGCDRAWK